MLIDHAPTPLHRKRGLGCPFQRREKGVMVGAGWELRPMAISELKPMSARARRLEPILRTSPL